MIPTEQKNHVLSHGSIREVACTIAVNAEAFNRLQKSLYSNPILAVIRELSTNAADAHREAGQTRPFDVQLPTLLDKTFCIRDYGVSMSPEFIENVYCSFFSSTKRHSNDYVGMIGIGAQSVFAYTEMYWLIAYYNGRKYTYVGRISEKRTPGYSFFGETDTDEPNGIEISFTVNDADINRFTQEASAFYRHWAVKPNFTGGQIKTPEEEIFYEDNEVKIWRDKDRPYVSQQDYVLMGNVAYPISRIIQNNSHNTLVKANIGDIDITTSRESVELTDKTKNYLSGLPQKISQKLVDDLRSKLDKLSDFEIKLAVVGCEGIYVEAARQIFGMPTVTINGKHYQLNTQYITINFPAAQFPSGELPLYYDCVRPSAKDRVNIYKARENQFILDDLPKYRLRRFKKLLKNSSFYLFKQKHIDFLMKEGVPASYFKKLSEIEPLPPKPSEVKEKRPENVYQLYHWERYFNQKAVDISDPAEKFFLTCKECTDILEEEMRQMWDLGYRPDNVYKAPQVVADKLAVLTHFKPFVKEWPSIVENFLVNTFPDALVATDIEEITHWINNGFSVKALLAGLTDKTSDIYSMLDGYDKYKEGKSTFNHRYYDIKRLANKYHKNIKSIKPTLQKVQQRYPLLNSANFRNTNLTHIINYINAN